MVYYGKKLEGSIAMKKIISAFVLMGLSVPAFAASVVPSHLTRNAMGGYDVTYSYKDKAKTGWYVTGRAEISLLNFKNKYSADADWAPVESESDDKYSFEPVFGGAFAAGKRFNYFWRAEVEGGYLGYFEDEDALAKFSISIPYMMVNGYYDFANGMYVGGGLGASLAQYKISGSIFNGFSKDKTAFSPMAGLMVGYSHRLDDNLVLDLRYRLAGIMGADIKLSFQDDDDVYHWFKSKTGMILDNSVSLGIRYEF